MGDCWCEYVSFGGGVTLLHFVMCLIRRADVPKNTASFTGQILTKVDTDFTNLEIPRQKKTGSDSRQILFTA